jgi:peptide-methionine (S)-S-oxide reductase
MGGTVKNPTYEQVCGNDTGHVEVVYLEYDPRIVSYKDLLKVFFEQHDPTTPNMQYPNIGAQYRSAIFYYSPQQKEMAEDFINNLQASGTLDAPIVTELLEAPEFYRAEEYHQRYIQKRNKYLGIKD